jgi:hypothetical protein
MKQFHAVAVSVKHFTGELCRPDGVILSINSNKNFFLGQGLSAHDQQYFLFSPHSFILAEYMKKSRLWLRLRPTTSTCAERWCFSLVLHFRYPSAIHVVNHVVEFFSHHLPFDFHGRGDFISVHGKFLRQQGKFLDLFKSG